MFVLLVILKIKLKIIVYKEKTCIRMFVEAFFAIAKT